MTTSLTRLLAAILAVALAAVGCANGADDSAAGDAPGGDAPGGDAAAPGTTISVGFQDSSVAPEFHRSWTLEVSEEQILLVVDSYGDEVAREQTATPPRVWKKFRRDLAASLKEIPEPVTAEICPGGTGLGLDVEGTGSDELDVSYDVAASCEDSTSINDDVIADLLELVEPFTDRVHLDRNTVD